MIRKGEEWADAGGGGEHDVVVTGTDRDLADAVTGDSVATISFTPTESDLARALGLAGSPTGTSTVSVDAMDVVLDGDAPRTAVNLVVVGTPPDRTGRLTRRPRTRVVVDGRVVHDGPATGVLVANGQFRRGLDVVPEGHPGDGRLEVHVHAVPGHQRRAVRQRLATGAHLPHPGITVARGREVEVTRDPPGPVEADLVAIGPAPGVTVSVLPGAFRLRL